MEITQEHTQEMNNIIIAMEKDSVKCSKDYQCYTSSLENLCPVKGVGAFDTIKCISEDAQCCGLSFGAIGDRYCNCPLRRYIAANFHR